VREIHHSTLRLDALVERIYAAHAPPAKEGAADGDPPPPPPPPHPLSRPLVRAFVFEARRAAAARAAAAPPWPRLAALAMLTRGGAQAAEYEDVGRCQLLWTARPALAARYGLPAHTAPEVQRLLAAAAARLTHRRQPGAGTGPQTPLGRRPCLARARERRSRRKCRPPRGARPAKLPTAGLWRRLGVLPARALAQQFGLEGKPLAPPGVVCCRQAEHVITKVAGTLSVPTFLLPGLWPLLPVRMRCAVQRSGAAGGQRAIGSCGLQAQLMQRSAALVRVRTHWLEPCGAWGACPTTGVRLGLSRRGAQGSCAFGAEGVRGCAAVQRADWVRAGGRGREGG